MNLVLIGTLIMQALGTFAEVNEMSKQQEPDVVSYLGYLSQSGETVQSALAWDKTETKTKTSSNGTTRTKSTK